MTLSARLFAAHRWIYRSTDGRIGHRLLGSPTLLLTTRGRRTGRPRTVALVYAADGRDLVVVGSNGGRDQPPAWLLNLLAEPEVEVQVGRRRHRARGRAVPPGVPEHGRLLACVDAVNRGRSSGYQLLTDRPIPVVVLEPAAHP